MIDWITYRSFNGLGIVLVASKLGFASSSPHPMSHYNCFSIFPFSLISQSVKSFEKASKGKIRRSAFLISSNWGVVLLRLRRRDFVFSPHTGEDSLVMVLSHTHVRHQDRAIFEDACMWMWAYYSQCIVIVTDYNQDMATSKSQVISNSCTAACGKTWYHLWYLGTNHCRVGRNFISYTYPMKWSKPNIMKQASWQEKSRFEDLRITCWKHQVILLPRVPWLRASSRPRPSRLDVKSSWMDEVCSVSIQRAS